MVLIVYIDSYIYIPFEANKSKPTHRFLVPGQLGMSYQSAEFLNPQTAETWHLKQYPVAFRVGVCWLFLNWTWIFCKWVNTKCLNRNKMKPNLTKLLTTKEISRNDVSCRKTKLNEIKENAKHLSFLPPRPQTRFASSEKKKNTFYAGVASTGSPQRRCVRWQVSIDQQRRCAPEAATKPQQPRLEKVEGKGSYFCSINPFLKHYEIDEFVWS